MGQPKYRDHDWLYEQYYEKGRSVTDIANELDCDHTTISKWRRRLEIPKPSKKVELECPVCGDEFTRTKSKVERTKYTNVCSRECIYEGRSLGIIKREVEGGYEVSEPTVTKECPACGDRFEATLSEDYKHCSRECFLEMHSQTMAGDGNPAYIDGNSLDKRCFRGSNWARIRRDVYERDDYTCQRCETKCISRRDLAGSNGRKLIQAHHIRGYESAEDNELSNLVTLCARCHGEVEGGASLNVGEIGDEPNNRGRLSRST